MDKITVAQSGTDVEDMRKFMDGVDRYGRGEPRSRCQDNAERAGWDHAEERGSAAYLRCMVEDDQVGNSVNWSGVSEIFYNAYGDRV